jgi:hypothetical protein
LIETDAQVGFTRHFTHPSGSEPKAEEHMRYLYASVLAQGLGNESRRYGAKLGPFLRPPPLDHALVRSRGCFDRGHR